MKTWLILLIMLFFCNGCEELKRAASADPNTTLAIEGAAEAGVGILQALSVLWPGAAAGAAGLGVALKAWRNAKGKLSESETNSEQYYHATESLVAAIGDYKTANPDKWAEMKGKLEGAIGPEAENVIRAIRGLPAKT
jgi:hypothetical protein